MNDDSGSDFGRRIRARREQLGLSRPQVSERNGPPAITLSKIEKGETRAPSAATLSALDTALNWAPGSAARLLADGAEPVVLPADAHRLQRKFITADPGAPLTASRVVELTRAAHQLEEVTARHPGMLDLVEVNKAIQLVTDRYLRTWLISLIESSTDEPGRMPADPIVDVMLAEYLRKPPADGLGDEDLADVLYVRWLIGQLDEESVEPAQLAVLQMRWAAARDKD